MISATIQRLRPSGFFRRSCGGMAYLRDKLQLVRRILHCRRNHARVLRRIRAKPKGEKIRVLFLVGEPAKWKCQKLYEAMRDSGVFEPVVGLTAWNGQSQASFPRDEDLDEFHKRAECFFDSLGDAHVRTYALHPRRGIDLADFSPDLVFYSEPWDPIRCQLSEPVSEFALPLFIPYFTPSHGDVNWESRLELHRFLYAYIVLNDSWAKVYRKGLHSWTFATTFIGLGHPALDFFSAPAPDPGSGVIYAPHYSFPAPSSACPRRYVYPFSTFDRTGQEILSYAQSHPELGWVFKPHPLLRGYLVESGLWTKEKTNDYYAAWERLGKICYDGDYQNLFRESRVLVTDCCSFLTEYGATGKPIIHLLREDTGVVPLPPSKFVFDTYYQVNNSKEMLATFKTVLEDGLDPRRNERLAAVRKAQIAGMNASANIVAYLRQLLGR